MWKTAETFGDNVKCHATPERKKQNKKTEREREKKERKRDHEKILEEINVENLH